MDRERQYFSAQGEWTQQERDFARRAVDDIGHTAWNKLLNICHTQGNEAFLIAVAQVWPDGAPPDSPDDQ